MPTDPQPDSVSKHPPSESRLLELRDRGLKHERAGQSAEAEACYRAMLDADPHCAEALHLLALTVQRAGQYQQSIHLLRTALVEDPDEPDILNDLAGACLLSGETQAASDYYARLVELRPAAARAHYCLAVTHELLERYEAAKHSYLRAIALQPDSAEFLCGLARNLYKAGDCQAAVERYEQALALDPNRWDIHNGLGLALTDLGNFDAAAKVLRKGLDLEPASAKMYASLGYLFDCQGDLASSADAYRRALEIEPALVSPLCHLGLVQFVRGELTEAEDCFQRVCALNAGDSDAPFYLATIHLLQGHLVRGWSEFESRWRTAAGRRQQRTFPQPQWKGEALRGDRILIHAEQGLGDTLHFVRYVPMAAAAGAQVILEVQPRLTRLLSTMEGAWQVVSRGQALPEFNWHCPLLSLPLAYGTETGTIPANIPYIYPPPLEAEKWRERLDGDTLRVGLVFAGSPSHGLDRWRSIPLAQFTPLLNLDGARFYSLQMGEPAEQIRQLDSPARIVDLGHEQEDFAETAAIIANLDLVISVDTSVAHLAGAMGKPVWILLPKAPDWRWLLNRGDSPWYPTARLFRQSVHADWQQVLGRVEQELGKLVAGGGPPQIQGFRQP